MKKIKNFTRKSWTLILALIFLSSCYEFVYISQDTDTQAVSPIKTKVCLNLIDIVSPYETPYFGILLPNDWKVKESFPYYLNKDQASMAGYIKYSSTLSKHMQKIDPAPKEYYWWVGEGNKKIETPGIYLVYPPISSGHATGSYNITYMIGDSYHGLNYLKSEEQAILITDNKTPTELRAKAVDQTIELSWHAPYTNKELSGYIVYRDGQRINKPLIDECKFIDYGVNSGSHLYTVKAVYLYGIDGYISAPTKICYSNQGPSMYFNGVSDKVVVFDDPSLQLNNHITLEAWIKPDEGTVNAPRIISKKAYELYLANNGFGLLLKFDSQIGSLTSKKVFFPKSWYHVAITFNGLELKMYINGELDNSKLYSSHLNISNTPLLIGKSCTKLDNYFKGNIDNVRIWSVARTSEEIKTSFSKNIVDDENGLVGNWNMQEGCSYFTCDVSGKGNTGFIAKCNWCATDFPFVKATNSSTCPQLMVPVMNYNVANKNPEFIDLEFKINPKLLAFQGVELSHTQLGSFGKVKTFYDQDGTIRIKALNVYHSIMQGDVLLYINLKSLQPHVNTTLDFYKYIADGIVNRTQSGSVIATDMAKVETNLKTMEQSNNVLHTQVYPNPARNSVNIKISNSTLPVDVLITNALGQVVYVNQLSAKQQDYIYKINTTQFEKGVYFINLNHGNEKSVNKLAIH